MIRLLPILIALSLMGCESEQERQIKLMERHVISTVRMDWRERLPLDDLYQAHGECVAHPEFEACDDLRWELADVAVSFNSCLQDRRSELCRAIVVVVGRHQLAGALPKAEPVRLPDSPWYWSMPTLALESTAPVFDYRREVASWWWGMWRWHIASCFALLVGGTGGRMGWMFFKRKRQARMAEDARRKAASVERDRIRRAEVARARAEAEQMAREERETELEVQRLRAELMEAERLAAEASARQVAEQAEAESILKAAFAHGKRARRKNVAASKK